MEGGPIHKRVKEVCYVTFSFILAYMGAFSQAHTASADDRYTELVWPCLCSLTILFIPVGSDLSLSLSASLFSVPTSSFFFYLLDSTYLICFHWARWQWVIGYRWFEMNAFSVLTCSSPRESTHFLLPESFLHTSLGYPLSHYQYLILIFFVFN